MNTGPTFSDFVSKGRGNRRKTGFETKQYRHYLPFFLLTAACLLIVLNLINLQIIKKEYYESLADENRTRTKVVHAQRGIIFDRNNKALVRNIPSYWVKEKDKIAFLDKEQALKLMAQDKKVETGVQRGYLYKDAFAHVLGYIGQVTREQLLLPRFEEYTHDDFVGKMGIEKEYETLLKGKDGKQLYEVNAKGQTVRFLGEQDPVAGEDIHLTVDVDLQMAVYQALLSVNKGMVVVSDPNSGAILALVSEPSFDPNLFTHGRSYKTDSKYKDVVEILQDTGNQPLLNRVIGGVYPPGSTFKLISAAAALESKAIDRNTKIEDTGVLKVGEYSYGNWYFLSYGRTEGLLDIVGAIKRSNDIFFYKAAEKTGMKKLDEMAVKFGLGQELGIDISGEEKGTLPDPFWKEKTVKETWYLGDTYHFGIGQGYLLTTPLQVNFWTTVFANKGTLYKPHLLQGQKHIMNKDFIKKEHIETIREGMKESCDEGGVAWPLFQFKVKNAKLKVDNKDIFEVPNATNSGSLKDFRKIILACKTGTAETYENEEPHAWITVFAPYYKPEIVVTVLVENGGEGSSIAGPIAKKILEAYFENKH